MSMTSEYTLTPKSEELTSLSIALDLYLRQFSDKTIAEAHEESAIGNIIRLRRRVRNLQFGNDIDYRLNDRKDLMIGNGKTITDYYTDRNA